MTIPTLPADMTVFVDGSRPSTFSLFAARAGDLSLVDTTTTLTQAVTGTTAGSQATYDRYNCGAGTGLIFGGSGAPKFTEPKVMNMASFAMAIPFSLVILARSDGAATLAEVSANIGASNGALISSSTGPTIAIRGPGGLQTADATAGAGWDTDNTARALILTYDGTAGGGVLTANGIAVPLTFGGVASGVGAIPTVGFVGADHATANPLTGDIAFFGIVPGRIISAGEAASILAYLNQFWYLAPLGAVTRNTIGIGDSLIVGFQTVAVGAAAYGFYQRALNILGPRFGAPNNNGVGGALLVPDILLQWTGTGVGQLVAGRPNVVVVEGGTNDISVVNPLSNAAATTIGQTTGTRMQTVVTQVASDMSALAGGPHYIEVQTITLSATNGFQIRARNLANNYIRANYRSWGNSNVRVRLVDIGADVALSANPSNPYPYYFIGEPTHPAKPGQERWAGLLARDILAAGL
jgi:lysophospholipase L1-like esterase